MTDETTTEQLADTSGRDIVRGLVLQVADLIQREEAEIERQPEDTPATGYTPPEGWRVLAVGEVLRDGDVTVRADGYQYPTERVGSVVGANQRYIRPIEPEPQQVNDWPSVRDLRHELKTVQTQLGESRQRVTQLEELVASLRTINVTQEKAFEAAGKENTALRNQLAAVKAELASVAADRQRLLIELDAAQQVPADSPELQQLRADLAEVTQDRDTYRHAHELLLNDANTAHERTKAMTVEAIAEWLEPIRLVDSAYLANATMQHLPQIMRHLTGLDSHAID